MYSTVDFLFCAHSGDLDVFNLSLMSLILSLDFPSQFPEASPPKSERFLQPPLAVDPSHPPCAEGLSGLCPPSLGTLGSPGTQLQHCSQIPL